MQEVQAIMVIEPNNNQEVIREGDVVIVYMGIGNMKLEKITQRQNINLHFGCFQHDQIIGKKYGSKIIAHSKGKQTFIYVLKPTPHLITQTLARKTQILFTMDISAIIFKLNILPGDVVVEAGTGSGSLSCSLATAIRSQGHLYTFQFNKQRADLVRDQFSLLKFINITVTHRDVIADGFSIEGVNYEADALFLDVPNPWDGIKNAKNILKKKGRVCCFSPCIEQVQKTCEELHRSGFTRVETHECLSRTLQRRQRKYGSEESQKQEHLYSTGAKTMRGHTGYLTFGYM